MNLVTLDAGARRSSYREDWHRLPLLPSFLRLRDSLLQPFSLLVDADVTCHFGTPSASSILSKVFTFRIMCMPIAAGFSHSFSASLRERCRVVLSWGHCSRSLSTPFTSHCFCQLWRLGSNVIQQTIWRNIKCKTDIYIYIFTCVYKCV